ncbi:hypothetical protein SKAU_G00056460 [Synaphobranchus kaupii]|uniref:DUF6729 domain-containing protein n=1 Tax=Synaphobranchus kaupii TaxID=118154 RepID=A0A9Q1G4W8_SYNKA|nr:hypothetical protein SKAU_G00056460 [Synaphobranchus kaupii]
MKHSVKFATTGVWPSEAGNRPAPRQKRWHDLYQRFSKPRFGGASGAAAKPNLVARKKPRNPLSPTTASVRTTTHHSTGPATASVTTTPPPRKSPARTYIRSMSPLSLPPSSPSTTSVRPSSVTASPASASWSLLPLVLLPPPDPVLPPLSGPAPDSLWLPAEMKKTIPPARPAVDCIHSVEEPEAAAGPEALVRVFCPVCRRHLTGYGIHKRARQVLDVDRYYLMVTKTLRCNSPRLQDQLPVDEYACDIRVIRMLRERTLGNSSTRLVKQLRENHGEQWLQRLARYLEVCADFVDRPSLFPVDFQEPPQPVAIPTNRWLLTVYGKDLMSRMGHIKARITSTFGSILKMDSTKKITKKLAGHAKAGLYVNFFCT